MTDVTRTFVGLPSPIVGRAGAGGYPCQGIYHAPTGVQPTTAFIATHYNVDFSEHYLADHLAERGYGFLGWNTRFRGAEPYFLLDHALAEIAVGVRWLREQGVERVVLLGNSGGGSLMSAYHSQSRSVTIRPAIGRPLVPQIEDLPAADLFVFVAAHPGRPEILTDWLDPSVIDEHDPLAPRDENLDLFNGTVQPPYSDEFVARYRAGQRARNERLTTWCLERLDELRSEGIGDQLFVMRRTWADPRFVDPTIDPSARPTPHCYLGDPAKANAGVFGIGTVSTLRTWLNMWSLTESDCRGAQHLERLELPTLLVQPDADSGVFPLQAEEILGSIGAVDKQMVTLPGDHYFQGEGQRSALADVVAEWTAAHGAGPA
ncbi:alpha/beta hydrolase [Desertimonas flava]|uniref:alpha/beta hydrolase n=1 Tax=Desertimonas flava TaxID=2064846 RepID=UPI000E34221A|nr:alpha/beta hydrolase [Desertimonas flava]